MNMKDQINDAIATLKQRAESGELKWAPPAREYIKETFPKACADEEFANWMNVKWCKHDTLPNWDSWQVLEESLIYFYNKLPYSFDLLYDIKTMDQVEMVARGELNWATVSELIETFRNNDMEVPECLIEASKKEMEILAKDKVVIDAETFRVWCDRLDQFEHDVNQSTCGLLDEMKEALNEHTSQN